MVKIRRHGTFRGSVHLREGRACWPARVRDRVSFDGPVLLVDDTVRTRWTVTVASALLTEVGASQMMPLAVHLLP
jgi:predicted amidophosphoribosyltransferase